MDGFYTAAWTTTAFDEKMQTMHIFVNKMAYTQGEFHRYIKQNANQFEFADTADYRTSSYLIQTIRVEPYAIAELEKRVFGVIKDTEKRKRKFTEQK